MKPNARSLLAILAMAAMATPALAQSAQEIERKEAELVAAWEKTPLSVRNAAFVTEKAPIYGAQSPRPSTAFKSGETLLIYMEPLGYTWQPQGNGVLLGITLDVLLKSKDGKILGGQEKFLNYQQASRHKLRELMLNVTLSLGATPPGEYVVEFVIKDLGGKSGSLAMPFTIAP